MYMPTGVKNVYKYGNHFVMSYVKYGTKYFESFPTFDEAVKAVENIPKDIKPIHRVIQFTNLDNGKTYFKYSTCRTLSLHKVKEIGNTSDAFASKIIFETDNFFEGKVFRDKKILENKGNTYNRDDLIASPGVYIVLKRVGKYRTLDGKTFTAANSLANAEKHVAKVLAANAVEM